jgi:Asp-tRNA(Asn)/Glu-tRNA(Gln) amidotransferase C subunit
VSARGAAELRTAAAIARVALDDAEVAARLAALERAIAWIEPLLDRVPEGAESTTGVGASGSWLRPDAGPPLPLARAPAAFAAPMLDGRFVLMPPVDEGAPA